LKLTASAADKLAVAQINRARVLHVREKVFIVLFYRFY
jgi:hypothetical protein